jgi:riboflavin kinase/FMN adenylyltransferase
MKFSGIVKKNLGRGRQLGFPTANIEAPKELEDGIYVGVTYCNTLVYNSIIFVGAAETFGEADRKAEVYILDFEEDLYDQKIEVETQKKIRDNKKFASEQELIDQMKHDEKVAREFFANYTNLKH